MSKAQTAAATEAIKRYADERAANDPAKLAKAARIVRVALARQQLLLADLTAPDARDAA